MTSAGKFSSMRLAAKHFGVQKLAAMKKATDFKISGFFTIGGPTRT